MNISKHIENAKQAEARAIKPIATNQAFSETMEQLKAGLQRMFGDIVRRVEYDEYDGTYNVSLEQNIDFFDAKTYGLEVVRSLKWISGVSAESIDELVEKTSEAVEGFQSDKKTVYGSMRALAMMREQ